MVLPAYAGMIPARHVRRVSVPSAPRIRGDDPKREAAIKGNEKCSPHTRG